MEVSTVPQVEKREFKNNTAGWLGVVTIDHKGEEKGVSIEPFGTIWLSEAEVILTARAPRLAEDNPFVEQTFIGINEAGAREEFQMRPLVPAADDARYVPTQERYVPPADSIPAAAAVHAEAGAKDPAAGPATTADAAAREAAVLATPPVQGAVRDVPMVAGAPIGTGSQNPMGPPAPAAGDDVDELGIEEEPKTPLFVEPPAPGQVISGSLQGADGPSPEAAQAAAPDATPPLTQATVLPQPQKPVPPVAPTAPEFTPEEAMGGIRPAVADEEHASAVDPSVGEETGQAKPPAGPAVEGEFAAAEEVGSPEAPAQGTESAPEGS